MVAKVARIGFLRSVLEVVGIVFARFRLVPRVWGVWLVAINAASLLFIAHVEGQVALGVVSLALLSQALIYQRKRFIRLLGTTHILWVPMLAWIALRLGTLPDGQSALRVWLLALLATNAVSLALDALDATRYVLGERQPYYVW